MNAYGVEIRVHDGMTMTVEIGHSLYRTLIISLYDVFGDHFVSVFFFDFIFG